MFIFKCALSVSLAFITLSTVSASDDVWNVVKSQSPTSQKRMNSDSNTSLPHETVELEKRYHHVALSPEYIKELQKKWYEQTDYKALSELIMRPWGFYKGSGRTFKRKFCDFVTQEYFNDINTLMTSDDPYALISVQLLYHNNRNTEKSYVLAEKLFERIDTLSDELIKYYLVVAIIDKYIDMLSPDSPVKYDQNLKGKAQKSIKILKNASREYPVFALYYGVFSCKGILRNKGLDLLNTPEAYNLLNVATSTGLSLSHAKVFVDKNAYGIVLSDQECTALVQNIHRRNSRNNLPSMQLTKKRYEAFLKNSQSILGEP